MSNVFETKVKTFSKLSFVHMSIMGHSSFYFVDDLYLQGDTSKLCLGNVIATFQTLKSWIYYYIPTVVNYHHKANNCMFRKYNFLHQYDFAHD